MKRWLLTPILFGVFLLGAAQAQEEIELEMWTLALSPTFDDYINGVISAFEEGSLKR